MPPTRLTDALTEFLEAAGAHLHGEVLAGAEVPFELETRPGRRGARSVRGRLEAPTLYCYRPLTGEFISARMEALERLPSWAPAVALLERLPGLEHYLASRGIDAPSGAAGARAALRELLFDSFREQDDFELRRERLEAALRRFEQAAAGGAQGLTLIATLHGLTIVSAEVPLTQGLTIARPDSQEALPDSLSALSDGLLAIFVASDEDPRAAIEQGEEVMRDLLRSLRLFGDGRVTLGALGWSRLGDGPWRPIALGGGGRPRGMLLVTAEQEDELRAFCNLVSRRSPDANELAWALRRFELACERPSSYEALSDILLVLRTLLEPEGPAVGMLPRRLAALCATPEERSRLRERVTRAIALEREVIEGTAIRDASGEALVEEIADHLRALLRDMICGHLEPDLVELADDILLEPAGATPPQPGQPGEPLGLSGEPLGPSGEPLGPSGEPLGPSGEQVGPSGEPLGPSGEPLGPSGEQVVGDASEAEEILDLLV